MRTLRALVTVAATSGVLLGSGFVTDALAATSDSVKADPTGFVSCSMEYERNMQNCYYWQTTGGQECDYLLYDCSLTKK